MNKEADLLQHYEALVHEYDQDLQRRMLLMRESSGDPQLAQERVLSVLCRELARSRVQILDLDLRMASVAGSGAVVADARSSSLSFSMPRFAAPDTIRLGSGIVSYGLHEVESGAAQSMHRWAGPSRRFGLLALLDRSEALVGHLHVASRIAPDITIVSAEIDGEAVDLKWLDDHNMRFLIPPLKLTNRTLAPSHLAFQANRCVVIKDVQPNSSDVRQVSLAVTEIRLEAA